MFLYNYVIIYYLFIYLLLPFQLILLLGGIPFLWRISGVLISKFGYTTDYEVCKIKIKDINYMIIILTTCTT